MAAQKILDKGSYSKIVIDEHDPGSVLKITDSTDYDNIIREVACLSYLNHPNIIRPTFIEFMPDGTCLIKMERYPYNLHEYMKKHGTIPIIRTIHMLIELLSAITYMHKNMIIHGDIKPKNILVAEHTIAICDFNISCLASDDALSSVLQTCNYRAPEINMDKERSRFDPRIDVFSAGCIMFELLTGKEFLTYSGKKEDEDSTINICKGLGIYQPHDKRRDRYFNLCKLTAAEIKEKIRRKLPENLVHVADKNHIMADYISIMCLCLMPNRHKRARSDQALYLMLNLYKKIVSDSLIIDRLMYGIEISAGVQTCHTNFDKNSKNYKPLNQLTIIKYMPADRSKLFNFSSINYANRLLLKYAKKSAEWPKDISVYTILFITMSVCGEAHRDIVDALEEKFTKRQLYNHAVRILVALDFLIFD